MVVDIPVLKSWRRNVGAVEKKCVEKPGAAIGSCRPRREKVRPD
jgi:hypothetical protein